MEISYCIFHLSIGLMHVSCHLDSALNVEIGVEYQIIFVVFLMNAVKCSLGHFQDLEKVG